MVRSWSHQRFDINENIALICEYTFCTFQIFFLQNSTFFFIGVISLSTCKMVSILGKSNRKDKDFEYNFLTILDRYLTLVKN
jgi:hypothetical protein